MTEYEQQNLARKKQMQKRILIATGIVVAVLLVVIGIVFALKPEKEEKPKPNHDKIEKEEDENIDQDAEQEELDQDDPQGILAEHLPEGDGVDVDISVVVGENENTQITLGIDVAKYQGTISWQKVAEAGIEFAMVRVGYRTLENGTIVADSNAKYNMQEAQKHGIKVGAYFFSTAVSEQEAIEEANWVADYISQYKITYPVAYNCEGFQNAGSRQHGMTKTQRTDVAMAFLKRIAEHEYTPMFYASKNEMQSDADWETSRIEKAYKVWVAQYSTTPYPQTPASSYEGAHAMWQYTNNGTVPGISKPVDLNVAYFGYDGVSDAKDHETPDEVGADVEALMNFTEVNESVTAKEKTNLRDKPSQGSDSTVLYTLSNGEVATRTGISNSGWSRIIFNGKKYYAVSSYLTTDLSYKPPQQEPDDGFQTQFTSVNENMTAKEEVNLRNMPSVTDANSKVIATIKNGDVVVRTGINKELGWSRVEYNGQTLYCISSYLTNY